MLPQEMGHGGIDAVVDPLDIHGEDPVPVGLLHHGHEPIVDDAGVADKDIHPGDPAEGLLHPGAVRHIAADGDRTGPLRHGGRGGVVLLVQEIYPVAPGGEQLHRRGPDAPGPAGDHDIFHRRPHLTVPGRGTAPV